MKNKFKLLCSLVIVFLVTGCSATYNVEIHKNLISDELNISKTNLDDSQKNIYENYPIPVNINISSFLDYDALPEEPPKKDSSINYYDVSSKNDSLKFVSRMKYNEYKNSRVIHQLFNNVNVNNYDDMFSIYGYNGVIAFDSYPNLDSVNVNIKVYNKVTNHNADKVVGNTYSWSFTKKNKKKTLYLELNPKKIKKTTTNKNVLFMGLLVIIGLILICVIYTKIHRKKFK